MLHKFPGGLILAGNKQPSCDLEILPAIIPDRLIFPLIQHVGTAAEPVIQIGDQVLKGQLIAKPTSYVSCPIHASSSGTVVDIGPRFSANETVQSIVIKTDGQDRWQEKMQPMDYITSTAEDLELRITDAGIIGMGGAGFPSHVKVIEGSDKSVKTLIINGVECEPYITCDDRLMRERTQEIISGTKILQKITGTKTCFIAVEEDMPEAYEALLEAAEDDQNIVKVPAIYPAGGEKQLILTLTGKRVPSHGLPIHTGVLVQNVATVAAIHRAVVKGEPLISRVVTVAGSEVRSQNCEVLNGTPVYELLESFQDEIKKNQEVIFGGSMMGKLITSDQAPILKKTSCVLVQTEQIKEQETACIRCGDCIDVCPEQLQPQMLFSLSKNSDLDALKENRLFDCIECGCCDLVCPSHIPLVENYQKAKAAINNNEEENKRAKKSRLRYQQRNERIDRIKEAKDEKKKVSSSLKKENIQDEISAAIKRAKAKRKN
ncbi:MAG: electron transport complex subunit RsxC [Gammaproteobacteria bacterium]